jgi:hypothetical protein
VKKRTKVIIWVLALLLFTFGGFYPKTGYEITNRAWEKSEEWPHWRSIYPEEEEDEYCKSILKSPEAFERPFSLHFRGNNKSPDFSFLLDNRYEKFQLQYIDFDYRNKKDHYEINKEYVIDYNAENNQAFLVDGAEWIKGSLPDFLPRINIGNFARWAKKYESVSVRAAIAYCFDDGKTQYQYIDYRVEKWTTLGGISLLGLLFIILLMVFNVPIG